ncbi:metallophosphoesterase [bacterium]|nr:metallophosphoesterase [bacterium]
MLIAIISDTHDRLDTLQNALDIINSRRADLLIHAGDFVSPFAVKKFAQFKGPICAVRGNNDGDTENLSSAWQSIKANYQEGLSSFKIGDLQVHLQHFPYTAEQLQNLQGDLFIYGHTHHLDIQEKDRRLIINPGECCGWITGQSSFVFYDTITKKIEVCQKS